MVDDKDLEGGGCGLMQVVSWCCLEGRGSNEKIVAIAGVVSEVRTEEHPNTRVVLPVQQLFKSFASHGHLKFTSRPPHSVSAYTDCWLR